MPSLTPRYSTSMRPTEIVSPTETVLRTASDTPSSSNSAKNSAVMGLPPKKDQLTCPPANRISWYMPAPGRLVISMPKAIGSSRRGSNFFTIARYSRTKEMTIMISTFQSPLAMR